ncbi:hypothetical protein BGZ50_003070 [Haplosporangium sp. Z 11]|nr:hypothetical protein BGZ50_003070 [Haplosporangium sp. Z 11]
MPHHPSNIPSPPFPTLSTPVQEKEPIPTPIPSSPASSPEPPLYYLASLTERYDEKKVPDQEQGQSNRFNEFQEESCVEDVFVTVPRRDDTSMPYNTFRMWFLGIMFTMLISFINEIFYLQRNQLEFSPAVVIIISLPLGHFLARALPTCQYEIPLFPGSKRRFSFTLNPGPFSPKEHALILLMSTCSSMPAKAIDIIVMQDIHFQDKKPFIAGLLLVLSTQIIGLSFTGMFRRILIWPVQMVWPTALAPVSLLRSLHNYKEEESEEKGRMSRGNYYATVCLSSMAWYFIPGYFFPTVGVLSVICWLNPDNIILSQWTGSQGLGIGTISLDWSYCAYYIQPLITPWFAQVNVFIGFVVTTYILLPLAYYNNLWGAKKYPILSTDFYQTNGTLYSVEDVLNDKNVLDDGLYNSYGPLRMSAFFAISYGVMFACVAATIVHTVLYHGREIVARFKTRSGDRGDIHTKLMRAYPEVPDLWYLILFVACAVLSFITCVHYDYMPWWGLLLALAIAFVLVLPLGLVMAIVNLQVEFNVVPQYIFGYLLPGHPIANATFKMFSHYVNLRVLNLLGAQKIAHYMKIPPQIMFCTQLVAGVIGGTNKYYMALPTPTAARASAFTSPQSALDSSLPYLASAAQRHDEKKLTSEIGRRHPFEPTGNRSDSVVEEVRVTVSRKDDTSMPANTFRMWFLGLVFTAAVAFCNQFFYMQRNQVVVGPIIVALVSLPLGHLLARILPTRQIRIPLFPGSHRRFSFTLNPGPFSIKEHVLIAVMTACSTNTAFAINMIVMENTFYNDRKPFMAKILLVLTTQITGLALAGTCKRILVWPLKMVWPTTLVEASFFWGLHKHQDDSEDAGRMSKMKYFSLVFLGSFMWYWFPGYLYPTLGTISWICWIKPNNLKLSQLTGSTGLGIGTISLDWSFMHYIQPLVTPWFSQVNTLIGFLFVAYVLIPLTYYSDFMGAKTFPIASAGLYDNDGNYYNIPEMMNEDRTLNEDLYNKYGPPRVSTFYFLAFLLSFAAVSSTIVHAILYHGKDIFAKFKSSVMEREDVHMRLMRAYPEVPDLWYQGLFVITVVLSFITCVHYDYMPWWALIFALFIGITTFVPIALVKAVTNQLPIFNQITEYIMGFILPGKPMVNATFQTYSYNTSFQAITVTAGLKLGHYMKIPPHTMFFAQLAATIVGSMVNLVTVTWLMNARPNICHKDQFYCVPARTFFHSNALWGVIGPSRMFGTMENLWLDPVQRGLVMGALLPIPFWVASRRFPNVTWLKHVHWPALLSATSRMPPALPYMYANGILIGFIFAYVLRKYQFRWWSRYNYLTSAALDAGVAVAGIAVYFFAGYKDRGAIEWWAEAVKNADHCPLAEKNYYGYSAR